MVGEKAAQNNTYPSLDCREHTPSEAAAQREETKLSPGLARASKRTSQLSPTTGVHSCGKLRHEEVHGPMSAN